jgi:hypothetical protein
MGTADRPLKSVQGDEPKPGSKAYWRDRALKAEGKNELLEEALKHEPTTPVDDLFDTIVEGGEKLLSEAKKYRPVVEGFLRKLTTKE